MTISLKKDNGKNKVEEEYKKTEKYIRDLGKRDEKPAKKGESEIDLLMKKVIDLANRNDGQKNTADDIQMLNDTEIFRAVYQAVRAQKNSGNRM